MAWQGLRTIPVCSMGRTWGTFQCFREPAWRAWLMAEGKIRMPINRLTVFAVLHPEIVEETVECS